ncbi:MAG: hypothetical protein AAFZ49_00635 [Cyanobacteria bacterium J06659_2]
MIATFHSPQPFPADPDGQRLCEIFGGYLWNFIQGQQPDDVTTKVAWQTITKYPLRPRVLWTHWQDAHTLIGVRFDHQTSYGLLDIDAGSPYCNPESIAQIQAALETIGITRSLLLRSSWSGGLHLYLPLPEAINTFNLAVTLQECLKSQGFRLRAGHLEIFPNVKAYGVQTVIEYKAHRLPLQPGSGSCLLDGDLNPIGDNLARFLWHWDGAAQHQDMETLHHACKIGRDNHRKKPKRRSHPVESWRHDLDTEITEGWTDYGQTNHLLKTIACYGRVFECLEGQALSDYVARIATSRPGYEQYCRHQHEIQRKADAWAKAAEHYYWPLGTPPTRPPEACQNNLVSFNRRQSEDAQQRIQSTYKALAETDALPEQITERAKAIARQANVSQQTLYKHLSLWHPQHHQGEIDGPTSDTALNAPLNPISSQSSEPLKIKELHPKAEIMKCKAPSVLKLGLEKQQSIHERGVWGDERDYPQASEVNSSIPIEELRGALQRQWQRLSWSVSEVSQFIAEQFGGRRRSELGDEELVLLLYYLQDIESTV